MAVSSPKRQKTKESSGSDTVIQRSELDSALALAALALDSPGNSSKGALVADQEREPTDKTTKRVSSKSMDEEEEEESRAPGVEKAPETPTHSLSKSRRVQFTSSQEEEGDESVGAPAVTPSPSSRTSRKRRPMVVPAHHRNAPPPHPPLHHPPLNHLSRLPPSPYRPPAHMYHPRHAPPPLHRHHIPPPPIPYHHHPAVSPYHPAHHSAWGAPLPPPPPHHPAYHHPRRMHLAPPPPTPRSLGRPGIHPSMSIDSTSSTTTASHSKKSSKTITKGDWVCDYCNKASFSSYEEACAHEEVCKHKYTSQQQGRNPVEGEARRSSSEREQIDYYTGCIPIAVESADSEWLSELNCFIRKNCIEAFSASPSDILKTSKRGRIVLNQVGIRCRFCANRPLSEKAVAAVSYPTSLGGIYESVKRWQRVHLPACMDVTDEAQAKLDALQNDTSWVPTTRQYWTDAARALGMVDTPEGIRFEREPSPLAGWMPSTMPQQQQEQQQVGLAADSNGSSSKNSTSPQEASTAIVKETQLSSGSGGYICFPEDQAMIPPYVYFLMRQVEPCYFTEADRFVARSKGPVGFAGFQCRHCQGHAGLGKYFPHHSKALSTNSTSQNIHAHILKCRKTTAAIKEELVYLKNEKMKSPRLVPGWRKTFFERVWERLHGDNVNI